MTKVIPKIFGFTLVFFGFLGFINNPVVGNAGIFYTNSVLNIIYILLGSALIFGVKNNPVLTLKIVGMAYLVMAILGFVIGTQNKLFGLIVINLADNWLHLGLAVLLFAVSMSDNPPNSSPTLS